MTEKGKLEREGPGRGRMKKVGEVEWDAGGRGSSERWRRLGRNL